MKGIVTDMSGNYRFHFVMIMLLLAIQYFSPDVYAFFYLKHVISKNSTPNSYGDILYKKGEYAPVDVDEAPRDYELVLVKHRGKLLEEIYYTKKGAAVIVNILDGKWIGTNDDIGNIGGVMVFAIFPVCGVILIISAMLHRMYRTDVIDKWQRMRIPFDRTEIVCLSYGITLHVFSIVLGCLGKAPG